jgi:putative ABC transport system permease protein
MNLFTIPYRNLRRKTLRTAMLVLVFSAGILSVVGLYYVSASVGESLEKKLTAYGANILVRPHSDSLNVSYGGFSMGNLSYNVQKLDMDTVEKGVRSIGYSDRISAVAPKLLATSSYNGKEFVAVGVDWAEELKIKSYWYIAGKTPDQADELVAGNVAAKQLGLQSGETVEIDGHTFSVAGIIDPTGSDDDKLVFMNIRTLQEIKNSPGEVTFVEVAALCSGCPIDDIVAQIKTALHDTDVTALQSIVKQRMFTISFVKNLVLAISAVILVIACFMLAVFMMASVAERKSEIGILRSMGYSRSKVFCLFSFEALFIGASAGLVGFGAGYVTAVQLLQRMDIEGAAAAAFKPSHLVLSVVIVCAVSVVSSLVPAFKAARTEPASAIIRL